MEGPPEGRLYADKAAWGRWSMRRGNVAGVLAILVLFGSAGLAGAQSRMPWGDPDLEGVWTNQTPVPLERPDALGNKRPTSTTGPPTFPLTCGRAAAYDTIPLTGMTRT